MFFFKNWLNNLTKISVLPAFDEVFCPPQKESLHVQEVAMHIVECEP